jgi:penicillin G amidase
VENERRRMRLWLKIVLWAVGVIAVIVVFALIFVNVYIGKSKPVIDGKVMAAFLDDDVTV